MFKVGELADACGGNVLQGSRETKVKSISTDTRTVKKGEAFLAIVGEKFDGHAFVHQAIERGVRVVVVSRRVNVDADVAVIEVKDTTQALGRIAAWHRSRFSIPVIAITGSAGKTTTKEMVAAVLKQKYTILKNVKTENNQFGVSQTLLRLKNRHQVAVLEVGTNHPGEIAWLAEMVRPTVAVFTNVGESHLEGLGSAEGVYREKTSLLKFLMPGGAVIFNADDVYLSKIANLSGSFRKTSYGSAKTADYRAIRIESDNKNRINFQVRGKKFVIQSPARHNVHNTLVAIACGELLKVSQASIRRAIQGFKFSSGRMEVKKFGSCWLINDTYNANPVSFRSAVKTLEDFRGARRKILVCGDMLELGNQSELLHRRMGEVIAETSLQQVFAVGSHVRFLCDALRLANSRVGVTHFESLELLEKSLLNFIRPGDVVLLKASRRMKMEKLVEALCRSAFLKNNRSGSPQMMEQLCSTT